MMYNLDVLTKEMENWSNQAAGYFRSAFGLQGSFALSVARLYIALYFAGLSPRITSGWRDPSHQRDLQARYDAGERAGYLARPASNSKHTNTNFIGQPAALAVDMPCTDNIAAAKIAQRIGLGSGIYFKQSDPGHYYQIGA